MPPRFVSAWKESMDYYIWNGIGAIIDLEDLEDTPVDYRRARELFDKYALAGNDHKDWTLWRRIPNIMAPELVACYADHVFHLFRTAG